MSTVRVRYDGQMRVETHENAEGLKFGEPSEVLLICPGKKMEYSGVKNVCFPDWLGYVDVTVRQNGKFEVFFRDRFTNVEQAGEALFVYVSPRG